MMRDDFHDLLKKAVGRDVDALEQLLELYRPLIERYSRLKGQMDEDLYQHLLLYIALNISRFKIY